MFSPTAKSLRLTLRALAHLLAYPDQQMRAMLPDLLDAIKLEGALSESRLLELQALAQYLQQQDPYDVQARFVEQFDRGRQTSLHLFEHVHGDSRDRGPALIDLLQTYEQAGLYFAADELPDHLPVVLEFASTQPPALACEFLAEMAHILTAIFSALRKRQSPYASVIAAVLEVCGQRVQAVAIAPEPDLDDSWAEPEVFAGCSHAGQAKPGQSQTMHFVPTHSRQPSSKGAPL